MKTILHLVSLCICSLSIFAQTNTILLERFNSTTFPPDGWGLIDQDGDGKNWYSRTDSETGNRVASSRSWEESALTPHNLLISSEIDLTDYTESNRLRLSLRIAATGNNYYQEHYKVVLSKTGYTFSDFETGTILLEETLDEDQSGWNLTTRYVELDDFAGEKFWLAWVHYNCSDEDAILLDDVHVYEGDDPEDEPPYVSWLVGSADDAEIENHIPGIVLAGGGDDNNNAMKWFLNRAEGGDIVVIRASGGDGYNDYLFSSLGCTVNSVETLLINSLEAAEDEYVAQQVRNAEGLFIAGGDQYDYYIYWKDTPLMDAINYLINEKGITVGGTSAGMAILGKIYYAPNGSSAQSATVLSNPFHSTINILGRNDFLNAPILENTITDTHFDQRDRSGRLLTFLARLVNDWGIEAKGIAANEYTAVCIDEDGKAFVFGDPNYDDYAYFLRSQDCVPETCTTGQPLTWNCSHKAVKVCRILGKSSDPDYFDLNTWDTDQGGDWQYWYAVNGTLEKVDVGTSVDTKQSNSVLLFPNPAKSSLQVTTSNSGFFSVVINSITGQNLMSAQIQINCGVTSSIDISNLNSGIYIISLRNEFEVITATFVISE